MIDATDEKILSELDKNARVSDASIAKSVRTSKQVVNYRIKRLLDEGVIEKFYAVLDIGKLSLNSYYIYMQFQGLNRKAESDMLKRISEKDYVGWLVSGTGKWDAVVLVFAASPASLDNLLNELLTICSSHLHEYSVSTLIGAEHLSYGFLPKNQRQPAKQTSTERQVDLDSTDKRILEGISQDARVSSTGLSKKIGIPSHTIRHRLKSLERKGLLIGFKPKLNVQKMGFQWYLLLVKFQAASDEKGKFQEYCKQHPRVYYVTRVLGEYNFMLDIHVQDATEFKSVLMDLKETFPDVIRFYESLIIFDEHKIEYFPRSLLN